MDDDKPPKLLGAIETNGGTRTLEIYEHGKFQIKITNAEESPRHFQSIVVDNQSLGILADLLFDISKKRTIRG